MSGDRISNESSIIEFKTSGEWTVHELAVAFNALDAIYTRLSLSVFLAREAKRDREVGIRERFGRPLEEWFEYLKRYGPSTPPLHWTLPHLESSEVAKEIEYYLSHTDEFLKDEDELHIAKVEMASPGGFSLRGLGEPIREIRELIKDLWYRNSQERRRGDLETVKELLATAVDYNLTPQQIHLLAVEINDRQRDLRLLAEDGKLALGGEAPLKQRKLKPSPSRQIRKSHTRGGSK